jgi:glycosyltransferase involved in cell wall biosynthesis
MNSSDRLVSVIIPCFNAEKWLREAIDSCIAQTYPKIEIIVINDGSTDHCLAIIKSYGDRVIWESGPNRGGSYARNRGFVLSSGDYIQYLDADDYLLPEKIERQVCCLEETGADVVYGDWRHRQHLPNGTTFLDDVQVSGPKEDFLESLLTDKQWVAPLALLFKRDVVARCDGWDEGLKAAQDRDFLISIAINDATFIYQPGCHSIYRRYGSVTVSTANKNLWLESHFLLMQKAEVKLAQMDQLSNKYRQALAEAYFLKIRPERIVINYQRYLWVLKKILSLYPEFKAESAVLYTLMQKKLGFMTTEIIIKFVKQFRAYLKKGKPH